MAPNASAAFNLDGADLVVIFVGLLSIHLNLIGKSLFQVPAMKQYFLFHGNIFLLLLI
jgi:hypothetical protein